MGPTPALQGREIQARNILKNNSTEIDISHFAPGMYIMHVYENNAEVKKMKFVKE